MKRAKRIIRELFYPPKWVLCVVPVASFAALIFIFACKRENTAAAYPVFSLSAYSLTILLAALPTMVGRLKRIKSNVWNHSKLIQKITSTAFGARYRNDPLFRSSVNIYQGMIVSSLYMLFCFFNALQYASLWFFSMSVYYMVLCIMRAYLLLGYRRRKGKGFPYELRCYRRIGIMLLVLNIPMGGMIILMVQTPSGFQYPGYLIYLSALYTFYMMGLSIVNLVKSRKMGSPILSAGKILNFVSAMMSVLGLQTAMITRFSSNGEEYRKIMNAITGGAIFLIVMATAAVMAIRPPKIKKGEGFHEKIRK